MGIVDKIRNRVGTFNLHPEIEILDDFLFHKEPFKVRVKLTAGERKVKVDQLRVDLVWGEVTRFETKGSSPLPNPILENGIPGYREHIIHKQRTRDPFLIAPGATFSTDLTFTTEKAKRSGPSDKFSINLQVMIPMVVDVKESKYIEVFPDKKLAGPMLAMVRKLHFQVKSHKIWRNDIEPNKWILLPSTGLYPNIDEVQIAVKEIVNENMEVQLTFMMCENPEGVDKGIREDISFNFILAPEEILDPNGDVAVDLLSSRIYKLLREAIVKFDENLMTRR